MDDFNNPNENNNDQNANNVNNGQPQFQQPTYQQPQHSQPQNSYLQNEQPQNQQPQNQQPQNQQPQNQQPQYQQPQYGGQSQYQQPQNQQQYQQNRQYQQPQYNYSQYQRETRKNNPMAIASLICGIISFLIGCCYYISWITSVAGIVLGIMTLKNNKEKNINNSNDKTMSIIGIVLSGIGILAAILCIIFLVVFRDYFTEILSNYNYY